jgi:hypothetical protein
METSMTESIETWKSFATRAVAVLILLTIGGTARAGTEDEVKTLFVNFVRAQNAHDLKTVGDSSRIHLSSFGLHETRKADALHRFGVVTQP